MRISKAVVCAACLALLGLLPVRDAGATDYPASGFVASQRSSGTITVSWNANGNPPGTTYVVSIGTDPGSSCMWVGSGTFQSNYSTTDTTLVLAEINGLPLQPGTTYIMDICNQALGGAENACAGMMDVATRESSFVGTESSPPVSVCGSQRTSGAALGIDASGNIWMVAASETSASLSKYDSAGAFISSTTLPDGTSKGDWGVQFDAAGDAYAVGAASGALTQGLDAAVYKVAAAGTILLSSQTFDDGFGLNDYVVGSTVNASGDIVMSGAYETATSTVAALWKYTRATGVISRTASYSGSGNVDAFFDVGFAMSGDLWAMGYSSNPATSGANRLGLALWKYDGAGASLLAGPSLQPGYLSTLDDRDVAAHLGVNGNGIYVAASRLNSQGNMDSAFLKYSLAGATQVVTGWTISGSSENPNGLGFDSSGNVWVGGWAKTSADIAAVWKYDRDGNLLLAQQASGHGSANDLAIGSADAVWLVDSGGPYGFASGGVLPGRATGVGTFGGDFTASGGATYDSDDFDFGMGVAVDTFTAGGPFIYEIIQSSQGAVPQAILVKYDFEGVRVASAALGSGWGMGVAVNPNGVYLTVQQPSPQGWAIDRFDKDLVFISSALYTAANNYSNKAITLDIHGNVFVTGWFQSAYKTYRVVKYDAALNYVASADFNDSGNNDMPADLDTSGQGDVYVTGVSLQGATTRYLTVKWDNNLATPISRLYTTGNPGYDPDHYMMGVAVNKSNGDAYVVGTNGHSDSLLAIKYDSLLTQITTATYASGIYGAGVAVGPAGDVYASGGIYSGSTTGDDEVIVKYDANLVFQSTKDYVAAGADEAGRIALDEAGKVYMACGAGDAAGALESFKARLIRFDFSGGAVAGGGINFTGAFPDALRAASSEGKNEFGVWLAIDTVTVGGPFLYEMFMSTTGGIASSPQDHYLVKYQAQTGSMLANVLISTTYAQGLAVDRHGSVYAGVSDDVGGGRGRLVKYDSGLNLVKSVEVDPTMDILDIMRLTSDGDFVYANVNGNNSSLLPMKVLKFDPNLVAVATAVAPSTYYASKAGVAVSPDRTAVYSISATSFSPGANKKIMKFDSGLANPILVDITSLFNEEVELAATNDAVYAAEARLVATSTYVYVRKFDTSLNYTGVSSTRQVQGPMVFRACQIQAGPDGYIYVSGADASKAGVIKLDPATLALVSSAAYAAGSLDQAFGLAVLSSSQVYVAGTSYNGTNDDAVVERMDLSGANVSGGTWGAAAAVDWAGNLWEVAKLNGVWQLGKFSSGGVFLSSTSLTDASSEGGWGVQFDASHNAYAVGTASGASTNGKLAGAVYQVAASGDLVLSYSTTTEGADQAIVTASTQDSSGNIWMTGLKGQDFVTYAGSKLGLWKYAGGLISLTTSYSRYSGGSDVGLGIQVNPSAIWVVGYSSNPVSPGPNKVDLALWKFAPAGASLVAGPFTQQDYVNKFGGNDNAAMALTSSFIYTAASKLNAQGRFDMAFSQYDLSGSTVLTKGWTGSGYSFIPNAMQSDSSGNLLIAGSQQADAAPQRSLAVWKYGAAGVLQSADTVSGIEEGSSLALTPADVAWLAVGDSTAPYRFNAGAASALPGAEYSSGGGGGVSFSGDFSQPGGAVVSGAKAEQWGLGIAANPMTGDVYVTGASSIPGTGYDLSNWMIVRYNSSGMLISSAALQFGPSEGTNNVAVSTTDGSVFVVGDYWTMPSGPDMTVVQKFDANLNPLVSAMFVSTSPQDCSIALNGGAVYVADGSGYPASLKMYKLRPSDLFQLASSTVSFTTSDPSSSTIVSNSRLGFDASGNVYAAMTPHLPHDQPGIGTVSVLKFSSNLVLVSSVAVGQAHTDFAGLAGDPQSSNIYVVYQSPGNATVIEKRSLGLAVVSSATFSWSAVPVYYPRIGPDGYLYMGGANNDTYFLAKFDSSTLDLLASAQPYAGSTTTILMGLDVLSSTRVFATGVTFVSSTTMEWHTVKADLSGGGGGGGTFSGLFSDASGAVFSPVAPTHAGVVANTATGDVYVAGASSSTGRSLGVLVRYDSLGSKISSITVSGSASWGGEFNNIALDPGSGNLYLSGYSSTDTPPYSTYFIKKYSPSLQELASHDFTGPGGENEFRQIVGINGGFVYAAHSFGPPFLLNLYKLNPLDLSVANQTSLSLPSTDISSHSQIGGGGMGFGGSGDVFLALAAGESNNQLNSLAVLRFSSLPVFISSVVPPQSGLSPEGSAGVTADPASGNVYAAYTSGSAGYLAKYSGSLGLVASATPALLPKGLLLLPDGTIGVGGDLNYAMQRFDANLNPIGGVIQGFPAGSSQSLMGGAAALSSTTVMLTGRDLNGTNWAWHTVKAELPGGGSIQGAVSYSGTPGGNKFCVAISTQSADIYPPSVTYSSHALTAQGPFSFAGLPTPNTYYMTAWLGSGSCSDHGAGMPSGAYNSLHVGGGKFESAPLYLAAGASASDANVNILDFGAVSGVISASQDGAVHFVAKSSAAALGYDLAASSGIPYNEEVLLSTGAYSVFVATSPVPYEASAFISLNGRWKPEGGDPYAVTAATITVDEGHLSQTGINLALTPYPIQVSFTGGYSQAGGAVVASGERQNEMGYRVLVDTRTGGGPYYYVIFHSSSEPNFGSPQASGIVKYDASGLMLATVTLQGLSSGEAFALDDNGNVYTNEQAAEHAPSYLVKFGPSLQRLLTVSPNLASGPYPTAMTVSNGYLYVHLDGGNSGNPDYVAKYDLATLSLQSSKAETYNSAGSITKNDAGDIYTVQISRAENPGDPKLLKRYDAGLTSVLASVDVTSLTVSRASDGAAYSNGSLFLVDVSTRGDWLALRKFDAATLAYSGQSSTYTLAGLTHDSPVAVKTGPDGGLYVAGSIMGQGSEDYLALRYDTDLNLVSSATFNGPAGGSDIALDLVVLDSNTVVVTGFSSDGSGLDAVTARLSLRAASRNHASGPGEIPIAEADDEEFSVGATFGAGMFFVPYQVSRGNGPIGVGARFMTQAGVLSGAPVSISKDASPWCGESAPQASFDGTNFLLVSACAGASSKVQAQLVSPSGSLVGSAIDVGSPAKDAGVAFDGTNYFVVWSTTFSANTYGQLVSPAGSLVGGSIPVSVGSGSRGEPAAAFGAGKYLVVWHDDQRLRNGYDYDIKGATVSTSGVVGPEFFINQGDHPSDMRPWVTSSGSNFVVAWANQVGGAPKGNWNISAAIVSSTGGVVSRFPVTSDPATSQSYPGGVWDGSNYELAYNDALGSSTATLRHQAFSSEGVLMAAEKVYASAVSGKAPFRGAGVLGGGRILTVVGRFDIGGQEDKSNADVYGMLFNPSTAAVLTGDLTYNRTGALVSSGTVRAALLSLGQSVPIRTSTAPFGSGGPWSYRFDSVPAGTYQVQAFVDVNGDAAMDANDPVGFSASKGFAYSGSGGMNVPVSICNRRPIAFGASLRATITPDDCTAPDQNGAYQSLYTFSSSRGQSVTIRSQALNFSDVPLRLYDSSNTLVASDDGGAGGGNSQIAGFPLAQNGLYTIGVSPYASGLSSATFNLSLAGSTSSISGGVSYAGGQGGGIVVGLFSTSAFISPTQTIALTGPGAYSFGGLAVGSTFFVEAWVDVNANGKPDDGEDKGYYGAGSAIWLSTQGASGVDVAISSSTPGGRVGVTGQVDYAGASSGSLHVEFWADSSFQGQPVVSTTGAGPYPHDYRVPVSTGQPFYVRAWLDVNENLVLDPDEPWGMYAPRGQGAEVVYATAPVSGIDLTMLDAGSQAGGNWAGEGTAAIQPSTAAAGAQIAFTLTYTAGAHGVSPGGRIGLSLPPGFASAADPSIVSTATWTKTLTANPMSALLTVDSGQLKPGQEVEFAYSSLYVGCQISSQAFTVTEALKGATTAQPLLAGSPMLQVVRGAPASLQPSSPYLSLTQGVLSDAQALVARDLCGNVSPATATLTATLSAKSYDYNQSQYLLDPSVGFSTGVAASTAGVVSLSFAVGQSSASFYALSASTGFKNMEVTYDISAPTTFYYGLTALPNNALTGVSVATVSFGVGGSSATIDPNTGVAVVYFSFNMGDPNQSWHVLLSSMPFRPGVAPTAVWESWGSGQPSLGQIVWDARYSAWLNVGVKVPSGIYYVRVEVAGGGVHDDSLLVSVVLPQLSGHVFDGGVSPNPPLAGANVQLYGPSGNTSKLSDSAGTYAMPGVAAGAYTLYLARSDFLDGSLSLTMDTAGRVSTFTALTASLAGSTNSAGGLDIVMSRAAVLLVAPSISSVSYSTQAVDLWGSLQVASSGAAAGAAQTYYRSLRLAASTTTLDDGGQWDAGSQMFIAHTLMKFALAAGTYTVQANLQGFGVSSATVYVTQGLSNLELPPLSPKSSVSGQVIVPANPDGMYVSVSAVALSSAASGGGGVYLPSGVKYGTYTVANLDPGFYLLRANTNGLPAITTGPISVPHSGPVDFPAWSNTGSSVTAVITFGSPTSGDNLHIWVSAWSPNSLNFGATDFYMTGGAVDKSTTCYITGLNAGATYQVYVNVDGHNGPRLEAQGAPPPVLAPGTVNFTYAESSGALRGEIILGANDFNKVNLGRQVIASANHPEAVGSQIDIMVTAQPTFVCQPSGQNWSPGCAAGDTSSSFTVTGLGTETDDITLHYATTGQTKKIRVALVNGSTTAFSADLSPQTFSISGSINNQITNALFNTNANIVANATYYAPAGYPLGLSSTTARVTAVQQDISQFNVAISTVFNPATSRVGFLTAAGTWTIRNVPAGVYYVRTLDLRACATCDVLVPSVGQVVNVAGASVSSVTFTLSDGYSAAGTIALDNGLQDSRVFNVNVLNGRQEVVRSTTVLLGDLNLGILANSANYSFANLPVGNDYTLSVAGTIYPIKYVGRPVKFDLQANIVLPTVLMQRAAYLTGQMQDANTGELINANNATLLAPNFQITAAANPWREGGFAQAASSIAARPVQGDGTFVVGPLLPSISYDLRLAQLTWDPSFLAGGSQMYAPVTRSGLTPQPGQIMDVGVIQLNQGQSLTGVVLSTTTGAALGGIKLSASPSFGFTQMNVVTMTNGQGVYSLWVATSISSQFDVTVAPRDGNLASDGVRYGQVTKRNVIISTAPLNFQLQPLLAGVTAYVAVVDSATGGGLSYPFGDQRGYPVAAVNLQPYGPDNITPTVPLSDPLGDIAESSDGSGQVNVTGLSTATYVYALNVTSLGYKVCKAKVVLSSTSLRGSIYAADGGPTSDCVKPGNQIVLQRGASLSGSIVKFDNTAPNDTEVGGIAAANFPLGEYIVGSVDFDPAAKTVNSYSISGFKPGINYNIVILPKNKGDSITQPLDPNGNPAAVSFAAVESTATKSLNLTYVSADLDCVPASKKSLGNNQFQVKIECNKGLRKKFDSDDNLDLIVSVSTCDSAGKNFVAPNGTGQMLGGEKKMSSDRRTLTVIYRAAASEVNFALHVSAYSQEMIDPNTNFWLGRLQGRSYADGRVFDFYTGLDSNATSKCTNIQGCSIELEPTGDDEANGNSERAKVDLPPGSFEDADAKGDGTGVVVATRTLEVGLAKGKDQSQAKTLALRTMGYVPDSVKALANLSAYPAEMAAAIGAYRALANSTSTVNGANPISSFYNIFLPAGIRHQLKQRADLTLSYLTIFSTSTVNPDNVNVYFYNATLGRFVLENTNRRLDPLNQTLTVSVDHFSAFVVLDGAPALTAPSTIETSEILAHNFPNPSDCKVHSGIQANGSLWGGGTIADFNGTMIRYSLPVGDPAATTIRIYNLNGELVRKIDQGQVAGHGTYYFPWDCNNSGGRVVASGVYIGEVQWGKQRKFFKIAIIKGSGL